MEIVNAFPVKSDIKRTLDKKTTLSKLERKFTPIQSLIVRKIELLNAKAFKSGFIFVLREKRVS
ncbi:hypothetical protein [Guptibacillus hwajinpoensis]|uniref:hypothetical protein n=1 Tax=Guptibacillus hwajinpoensis TaxID=208199 RepID=UPI003735684E